MNDYIQTNIFEIQEWNDFYDISSLYGSVLPNYYSTLLSDYKENQVELQFTNILNKGAIEMKDIRPFGWVIIVVNAYIIISFFAGYVVNADDTANGIGIMVMIFFLAILNTFLYVLYRVTGTKKRECPACGQSVKKGLTVCPSCNFDFMKAAGGEPQDDFKKKVVKNKTNNVNNIVDVNNIIDENTKKQNLTRGQIQQDDETINSIINSLFSIFIALYVSYNWYFNMTEGYKKRFARVR